MLHIVEFHNGLRKIQGGGKDVSLSSMTKKAFTQAFLTEIEQDGIRVLLGFLQATRASIQGLLIGFVMMGSC